MVTLGSIPITLMAIAFAFVCGLMMLVILIQKPRGGGLSGAFGGAGGSAQAAFGAKTGDVLTWFTVVLFVLFLLLAMGLTWAIGSGQKSLQNPQTAPVTEQSVPDTTPPTEALPQDVTTEAAPAQDAAEVTEPLANEVSSEAPLAPTDVPAAPVPQDAGESTLP